MYFTVKLQAGTLRFTRQALLDTVVRPLMSQVGQLWAEGELRIVHGHLASVVVHTLLSNMLAACFDENVEKPRMLVADTRRPAVLPGCTGRSGCCPGSWLEAGYAGLQPAGRRDRQCLRLA